MYVKRESLECQRLEEKCYILKRDLKCIHGTFTVGSRVRIERSYIGDSQRYNSYSIESADGYDELHLDRNISIEKWSEDMLTDDIESTLKYQTIDENFEQAKQSLIRIDSIKETCLWVLFAVMFIVGGFGFIMTTGGQMNFVVAFAKWAIGIILAGTLLEISNSAFFVALNKLRDSRDQQCHDILASKEV